MGKESDLLEAARSGNIALVEKLLNPKSKSKWPSSIQTLGFLKGPNISCQDQNGETPLHFAALNNHKEIVELLLKYQASANIPDQKGCYPLHLAAWRGNLEICQILLTIGPSVAIVNNQNLDGDTALHSAAQYGHMNVVNVLLQKFANPLIKNNKGEKALDLAVMFGRQETVEMLLNSPDSKIYLNPSKQDKSPLHLAAKSGNVNVVRMLLGAGFDVNHQNESGTALHDAALHGKLEVFRLLLVHGADVLLTNEDGKTTIDLLNDLNNPVSSDMKKLTMDFDNDKMKTAQKNVHNSRFNSVAEDYDLIPKSVGKLQCTDNVSHMSRNSMGSSTSSVFHPGGAAEEESIYDCPQAGARALHPPGIAKSSLASSSFNKTDKPNTPKKPPRKNVANSSSKTMTTIVDKKPAGDSQTAAAQNISSEGVSQNPAASSGCLNSAGSAAGKAPAPVMRSVKVVQSTTAAGDSCPSLSHGKAPVSSSVPIVASDRSSFTSSPNRQRRDSGVRPGNLSVEVRGTDAPCELPTPDHPPPSPETALLDIQQLINFERRKSRDMHTSTELDDACRPSGCEGRREAAPNFGKGSQLVELNNNNNVFHGLTLGSSTTSPARKSSRMMRFNNLINSRTLPAFPPSPPVSSSSAKNGNVHRTSRMIKDQATQNPCPVVARASVKTNSQKVTDVDGGVAGNKEEWAQIENLFKAPFADGFEILINEFDKRMTSILSDEGSSNTILSITDWLESINLSPYENILIVNGFDDMQFMSLLELSDMVEMGIKMEEHRVVLLESCKSLSPPPPPCFDSLRAWLESLRLFEYHDVFTGHGCREVEQVFDLSESQLQSALKYMLLGHRKRVKNTLKHHCSKFPKITKSEANEACHRRSKPGCMHRPESLITGCCNYAVRYLGTREVSVSDGNDPPQLIINKMKDSLDSMEELPTVTLSISYLGVRFIDFKNKAVICSHDISNIFSASQGEDCLNYFAYVTQSVDDGPFLCHVFHARSEELAREIMLVLGEAFYVAYQLAVRDHLPTADEAPEGLNRMASKNSYYISCNFAAAAQHQQQQPQQQANVTEAKVAPPQEQKPPHTHQSRSTEI